MQIPSMDIREFKAGDALRSDEVEITAEQRHRIHLVRLQQLRDREAELAARPGCSKAAKRRRARA